MHKHPIHNDFLNERPFSHVCHNGTRFDCERCDLRGPIEVRTLGEIDRERLTADFAEFAGWHGVNIHPYLNGFNGYDCLKFVFKQNGQSPAST